MMTTLPMEVPKDFRIIAHRGASSYAPDNTMAAFRLAYEMGLFDIELDTQLTTDGVVALCHDRSLAHYRHGDGIVEEHSWAELAALDMGSWFSPHLFPGEPMITLDQLLAEFGTDFVYHVELKGRAEGLAQAVHNTIEAHGLRDFCVITSFSYDWLVAMREIDPEIRMGWLFRQIDDDTLTKAKALNLFQLCPFAGTVTHEEVTKARQVVSEVRAWGLLGETVLGQAEEVTALIQNVLNAGCDGMTINWPDWVKRVNEI